MTADSWTDEELIKIENHLRAEFKAAQKEIKAKSEAYFEKFFKMDKIKAKQVEDGTLSQEEYNQWRHNKIMYGEHWHNLVDQITKELLNVNKTALDYINGKVPQIYAVNFNSIAEVIENSPVEGYSFELVNADTVKNLEGQEDIMLPPPKDIDAIKDIAWNAKKVNSVVMQGILQGSNMKEIADKLAVAVCDSNEKAAIRNARTMVTAAENSGRQSGMNRAEASGIIFKKRWIATNDSRTRPSHMAQHGELVNNGEKFSNGLMFPGDWSVNLPHEIYNCRCTLGSWVTGFKKLNGEEPEPHTKHKEPKEHDNQVVTIENARTVSQVTELLANTGWFSERGIERYLSLEGCDLESAKAVFRGYQKVFEKIPNLTELFGQLYSVNAQEMKHMPHAWATGGLMSIQLNTVWFSNYEKLLESYEHSVETGFHIPDSTVEDIVVHELGHNIDQLIAKALGKGDNAYISKNLRKKVMDSFEKKPNIEYAVSGYATKNHMEWFAECFVEYVISDNPRKVAAKFGEELEKLFEKVEKANKK